MDTEHESSDQVDPDRSFDQRVLITSSMVLDRNMRLGQREHGWLIYQDRDGLISLIHLPPRDQPMSSVRRIGAADPGNARVIRDLGEMPIAISALDARVYLLYPQHDTEGDSDGIGFYRVYSGEVAQSIAGAQWVLTPSGRLGTIPRLESHGDLVWFGASSDELWASFKAEDQLGKSLYVLMGFDGQEWNQFQGPSNAIGFVGLRDQLVVLIEESDRSTRVLARNSTNEDWIDLGWDPLDTRSDDLQILGDTDRLILVDSDSGEEDGYRVRSWSKHGIYELARGIELPDGIEFVSLGQSHRLIGVGSLDQQASLGSVLEPDMAIEESEARTQSQGVSVPGIELFEIDVDDGSVLYSGAPVVKAPVSAAEMRFLVLMMILMMIGVLVIVILPEKNPGAMAIPDGCSLALGGSRLIASILDFVLISTFVGRFFDVELIEVLTLSVLVRPDSSWMVLPAILVSGGLISGLMEWGFGGSFGKTLLGLRVVRAQPGDPRRVSFVSSMTRNTIKWLLPPVVGLALVDPESLHRGDRVTSTVVVNPINRSEKPS